MLKGDRRGVVLLVVVWVVGGLVLSSVAAALALQAARWESRARWASLGLDLAGAEVARAATHACAHPDARTSVPILTTNRLLGRVEVEPISASLFRIRWGIGDGHGWREGTLWARPAGPAEPGRSEGCAPGLGLAPLPGLPTAP